jgi:hypothetical protein
LVAVRRLVAGRGLVAGRRRGGWGGVGGGHPDGAGIGRHASPFGTVRTELSPERTPPATGYEPDESP